jgi:hypothetical protein
MIPRRVQHRKLSRRASRNMRTIQPPHHPPAQVQVERLLPHLGPCLPRCGLLVQEEPSVRFPSTTRTSTTSLSFRQTRDRPVGRWSRRRRGKGRNPGRLRVQRYMRTSGLCRTYWDKTSTLSSAGSTLVCAPLIPHSWFGGLVQDELSSWIGLRKDVRG